MPTHVTLELTVFIPSAVVLYSVLGYGGAFNGGTKCSPRPLVDLDQTGSGALMVPPLVWGTTYKYNEGDSLAVTGKPQWYCALRGGATPIDSRQLERTEANLDVQLANMDGATHAVKFTLVGGNPLLTLAPAIDADIVVGLRKEAGEIQFAIRGKHDGFPNYTLQINGKQVYAWDCVAKGEDPSALGPPMDQSLDSGWRVL